MAWFGRAVRDRADLREIYEPSSRLVQNTSIDHLDRHCRDHLAVCGFVLPASADAEGRADVTPRGAPRGFVSILGDRTLAVPDASGNGHLDTLRNVVRSAEPGCWRCCPGAGRRCASTAGRAPAPIRLA